MKYFLKLLSVYLLAQSNAALAQSDWFAQFGGDQYQRTSMMAKDGENNIYICGSFRGEFDADPGDGVEMLTSGTYEDIYLMKLSESGNLIWSFKIGSGDQDFADKILIDNEGNVHIMGTFQGAVDFDPGPGVFIMQTLGNPLLSSNMFFAKYAPDGSFMQAIQFRTTEENEISRNPSLAIDAEGNFYISGSTSGSIDMDPLDGEFILPAENDFSDIVIAKLDPSANLIWAERIGGDIGDLSAEIVLDDTGNLYCTGTFRSTVDFNPGLGTAILSPQGSDTFNDIFILSLDGNGAFRWVKGIGWDGSQDGRMIRMGADGYLYGLGTFENTVDFNPGGDFEIILTANSSTDNYIMKISTEGEVQWAKGWGGDFSNSLKGFSLGPNNELVVTGSFNGFLNLENNVVLSHGGGFDGYVITWNANGGLDEAFSFGGEDNEHAVMAFKEADNQYLLAGYFDGELELQENNPNALFQSFGADDWFLALYNPFAPVAVPQMGSLSFNVFPNPTSGNLSIQTPITDQPMQISLVSAEGKPVRTWLHQPGSIYQITGLAPGMYYLISDSKEGRRSDKVVVQ